MILAVVVALSRFPWVSSLVLGVGIVGFVLLSAGLPATVPVHFGLSGAPDRWASPDELWVFAVGPALVLGLDAALTSTLGRSGEPGLAEAAVALRRILTLLTGALVLLWLGTTWDIGHGALGPGFYTGIVGMLLVVPASMLLWTRVPIPAAPPTAAPRGWTGIFWYAEPTDPRIWVPKRFGWGWTLNFAHPKAWGVLGLLLLPIAVVPIVAALSGGG